jgi:hypothetical protein
MRRGLGARAAHEATLTWQRNPYKAGYEAQIYSKDAIQAGGNHLAQRHGRQRGLNNGFT